MLGPGDGIVNGDCEPAALRMDVLVADLPSAVSLELEETHLAIYEVVQNNQADDQALHAQHKSRVNICEHGA